MDACLSDANTGVDVHLTSGTILNVWPA